MLCCLFSVLDGFSHGSPSGCVYKDGFRLVVDKVNKPGITFTIFSFEDFCLDYNVFKYSVAFVKLDKKQIYVPLACLRTGTEFLSNSLLVVF